MPLHLSTLRRLAFLGGALLLSGSTLAMASSHLIFLGTYTRTTSKGIYAVRLDDETGALSAPVLAAAAVNPAWIAFAPGQKFLYTIHASKQQAIGFAVDAANARLTALPLTPLAQEAAAAPSHLVVDATGRMLMTANYGEGYVASMPVHADGTLGPIASLMPHSGKSVHPVRQDKPHAHSVTLPPDNRHVIVCDLGLDKIFSYAIDPATARLAPANPPFVATEPGAGPRHFKFSADGRRAYAINEMGNTLTAYDYTPATGTLLPRQTVPTLPADYQAEKVNTTAEVRIHPNGRFVYGSNRGHDSIAVYAIDQNSGALSLVEIAPSGGKVPRNFALSPNGKWLVCGHQDSDNLTVFRVDAATGKLSPTPHTAVVPACVCVLFYD